MARIRTIRVRDKRQRYSVGTKRHEWARRRPSEWKALETSFAHALYGTLQVETRAG